MDKKELYLRTLFCCSACDGEIAPEEVALVKDISTKQPIFAEIDVEPTLNTYISQINAKGAKFLTQYLSDIAEVELSKEEQLHLVDLAFQMIEADNVIQYSEVKFFKKIRSRLSLTDEEILLAHPDKEDFLLPDIQMAEEPEWDDSISFETISFDLKDSH